MPGLLPRLFVGALAIVFGGLIGLLIGHERGAVVGALLGGLLGFLGLMLFDALRGWRLLRWLRGGSPGRRRRATRASGASSPTASSEACATWSARPSASARP